MTVWLWGWWRRGEQQWRSGKTAGVICALVAVGALVALMAGLVWMHRTSDEQTALSAQVRNEQMLLSATSPPSADSTEPVVTDFVRRLPEAAQVQPVVAELQRSSSGASATLGGVQLQQRAATPEQLGRAELTVSLRGSYPNLKRVLAETLDRFPNLTLRRIHLRRTAAPTELEASVVLGLWGSAAGSTTAGTGSAPSTGGH